MIWPLIIVSYLALFVFGITDNVRGPLFPEILKEFQVSDSMGSMMFAVSSLTGVVVSIIVMYLVKFFDRRVILRGAAFLSFLVLLCMAIVKDFPFLIILNMTFGLSAGVIGLIPNVLLTYATTLEKRQQYLSGLHAMYGISSLLAPIIVALVSHFLSSWRWCFIFVSIAPLFLFIYSFHPGLKINISRVDKMNKDIKKAKKKNLYPQIYLATMLSFCVIAEVMISSRMALFMQREFNAGVETSSLYTTYFFMALLMGRLLFAFIRFPFAIKTQLNMCGILMAFFIFVGLKIHPFGLILASFCVAPFYPLSVSWMSNEFPDDMDRAISLVIGIDSFLLSVMHLFVGKMSDEFGISWALMFGIVFIFISLFFVNTYKVFFKKEN